MTWWMVVLMNVAVLVAFWGGWELGHIYGHACQAHAERQRLGKLVDRVAEIDPDALDVMCQAAQELQADEAQVMELEKLMEAK